MSGLNDYLQDGYYTDSVANAPESARVAFIRKTYLHVAGATVAFVLLEAVLLNSPVKQLIMQQMKAFGGVAWIALMLLFMGTGFISRILARSRNPVNQYLGLGLYVVVEAIFFLPILTQVTSGRFGDQNIPLQAGIITLAVFGGLTAAVFMSKKDFSFLATGLRVFGFASLGLIVAAVCFGGISLGLWFSFLMVALVCGYILYDTSNVIHHYGVNDHVGAALELFADVAMLFYYIVRILQNARD
jgi:FtsH-binding integral membrane protein